MLDQAKSSPNSRRLPTAGTVAPCPAQPEPEPPPVPAAQARLTRTDDPLYSIRLVEDPGTLCADCGKQETGCGPVGFRDDDPVCDLCLLEGTTDLGLMMAMTAVSRAYAETGGTAEEPGALHELGVFARIYHQVASKSWPLRIFRIPGFTTKNDTTH